MVVEASTRDLFVSEPFLIGCAIGFLALVITVVAAMQRSRPTPIGGVMVTGAALFALALEGWVTWSVAAGVASLAVAGALLDRDRRWAYPFGLIGVVLLVLATPSPPGSVNRWLVGAAIVVVAPLLASFDYTFRYSTIALPLLAVSYLGMLVTVPDTARAIVAVGATLPMALAGWPLRLAGLGRAGSFACAGLFVWLAFAEGVGRPGSVVGAIGALGLLIAWPAAHSIRASDFTRLGSLLSRRLGAPMVIAAQGAVALYAARVAGLKDGALYAALLVLPMLAAIGTWASWPDSRTGENL